MKKKKQRQHKPNVELDILHSFERHMNQSLERFYQLHSQQQEDMMRNIMAQHKFNELNPSTNDGPNKKNRQKRSNPVSKLNALGGR